MCILIVSNFFDLLYLLHNDMKTKIIVAGTVWILGLTSMVLGTTTFAANTKLEWRGIGMHSWAKMNMLPRKNNNDMMKKFSNTGDALAFKTAVDTAITNNDYSAFVVAHTKYSITQYLTKEQFTSMIAQKSAQDKINMAITNGDYATWKVLNGKQAILNIIDTEAKFKRLQEMHTYQEKVRSIAEELWLPWPMMGQWHKQGKKITQ